MAPGLTLSPKLFVGKFLLADDALLLDRFAYLELSLRHRRSFFRTSYVGLRRFDSTANDA
jgi:hypothetical protein